MTQLKLTDLYKNFQYQEITVFTSPRFLDIKMYLIQCYENFKAETSKLNFNAIY